MCGEGEGVPADQTAFDGTLETRCCRRPGMLEMVENEPCAGCPDELRIGRVLPEEMLAGINRLRNEALMVEPPHLLGVVGKPDVEVRLEHKMDHPVTHEDASSFSSAAEFAPRSKAFHCDRSRARASRARVLTSDRNRPRCGAGPPIGGR